MGAIATKWSQWGAQEMGEMKSDMPKIMCDDNGDDDDNKIESDYEHAKYSLLLGKGICV